MYPYVIFSHSAPANFLEIDVLNPSTTILAGKKKFTDYEIRMRVSIFFESSLSLHSLNVHESSMLFLLHIRRWEAQVLCEMKKSIS